uniref:RAS (RAD and GEM)-like GTP binding 2 n=1 Tax=Labrus bergylta TaxID=56723 RepID=A0A3Q3E7I3_9LABR
MISYSHHLQLYVNVANRESGKKDKDGSFKLLFSLSSDLSCLYTATNPPLQGVVFHMCSCVCLCHQDLSTLQCDVCILVFSVTDRRSFHRTAQLRLLLREAQPQTPIILVGNKSDLVRSREISAEEAQSSANMFDCVYLELSASLDHGTNELLEAAVRTARGECVGPGWTDGDPGAARRESLTSRAKRFLAGLVPRRYREMSRHRGSKILRQKSRSCHDLSAL